MQPQSTSAYSARLLLHYFELDWSPTAAFLQEVERRTPDRILTQPPPPPTYPLLQNRFRFQMSFFLSFFHFSRWTTTNVPNLRNERLGLGLPAYLPRQTLILTCHNVDVSLHKRTKFTWVSSVVRSFVTMVFNTFWVRFDQRWSSSPSAASSSSGTRPWKA